MSLVRIVRPFQRLFRPRFPLSRAAIGCQVDRGQDLAKSACFLLISVLLLCFPATSFAQPGELPVIAPIGLVWETPVPEGSVYSSEVERLLEAYEQAMGFELKPGVRGQVGLKVNTRSGRGLSTPLALLRAMIEAMESRGFSRENILLVDYSTHSLRQAGVMPFQTSADPRFEGCRVLALDTDLYYDDAWFYDSPLPPALQQEPQLFSTVRTTQTELVKGAKERKSFLPLPLLLEVDFWLNLATASDDPALGVDGALANATLWNVSNSQRFLANDATASAAVAEIAAVPELQERMVLHFMSLECYQFIGGPRFNSRYSRGEERLWMSSDPVALDRLMYERLNKYRGIEGFPLIEPMPRQFPFAASLGLGTYELSAIRIQEVLPPPPPEPEPIELPAPVERSTAADVLGPKGG